MASWCLHSYPSGAISVQRGKNKLCETGPWLRLFSLSLLLKDEFLLEYSCSIMLCSFLLYSKVNQLYVYMCVHVCWVAQLCPTLCNLMYYSPPGSSWDSPGKFMGFSRQEYWGGLPFPSPEDLPNPGIKPKPPVSPALQADSLPRHHQGKPTYTYIPSLLGHHRALSRASCAIE